MGVRQQARCAEFMCNCRAHVHESASLALRLGHLHAASQCKRPTRHSSDAASAAGVCAEHTLHTARATWSGSASGDRRHHHLQRPHGAAHHHQLQVAGIAARCREPRAPQLSGNGHILLCMGRTVSQSGARRLTIFCDCLAGSTRVPWYLATRVLEYHSNGSAMAVPRTAWRDVSRTIVNHMHHARSLSALQHAHAYPVLRRA